MAMDCSLSRVSDNRLFYIYAIALYAGLRMRNPTHAMAIVMSGLILLNMQEGRECSVATPRTDD